MEPIEIPYYALFQTVLEKYLVETIVLKSHLIVMLKNSRIYFLIIWVRILKYELE